MGGEDVESWHRLSRSLLHVNRLTLKLRHDNSQQPSNFSNGLSGSSRSAIQPTTSLAVLGRGAQFSTLAAGCPSPSYLRASSSHAPLNGGAQYRGLTHQYCWTTYTQL